MGLRGPPKGVSVMTFSLRPTHKVPLETNLFGVAVSGLHLWGLPWYPPFFLTPEESLYLGTAVDK